MGLLNGALRAATGLVPSSALLKLTEWTIVSAESSGDYTNLISVAERMSLRAESEPDLIEPLLVVAHRLSQNPKGLYPAISAALSAAKAAFDIEETPEIVRTQALEDILGYVFNDAATDYAANAVALSFVVLRAAEGSDLQTRAVQRWSKNMAALAKKDRFAALKEVEESLLTTSSKSATFYAEASETFSIIFSEFLSEAPVEALKEAIALCKASKSEKLRQLFIDLSFTAAPIAAITDPSTAFWEIHTHYYYHLSPSSSQRRKSEYLLDKLAGMIIPKDPAGAVKAVLAISYPDKDVVIKSLQALADVDLEAALEQDLACLQHICDNVQSTGKLLWPRHAARLGEINSLAALRASNTAYHADARNASYGRKNLVRAEASVAASKYFEAALAEDAVEAVTLMHGILWNASLTELEKERAIANFMPALNAVAAQDLKAALEFEQTLLGCYCYGLPKLSLPVSRLWGQHLRALGKADPAAAFEIGLKAGAVELKFAFSALLDVAEMAYPVNAIAAVKMALFIFKTRDIDDALRYRAAECFFNYIEKVAETDPQKAAKTILDLGDNLTFIKMTNLPFTESRLKVAEAVADKDIKLATELMESAAATSRGATTEKVADDWARYVRRYAKIELIQAIDMAEKYAIYSPLNADPMNEKAIQVWDELIDILSTKDLALAIQKVKETCQRDRINSDFKLSAEQKLGSLTRASNQSSASGKFVAKFGR